MKTLSRSIRRWFSNNPQERLSELRQPKKSRRKAPASLRPMFEVLEDRTLMSVPPQPIVAPFSTDISQLQGNETMPVVAVDPLNPQKLVAAYEFSPTNVANFSEVDGDGDPDQTTFIVASFSTDGGKNWSQFFLNSNAPNLNDAAEKPSTADFDNTLELADSPSVSFDRNGQVYLVFDAHTADYASGAIALEKFDFSGATPAQTVIDQVLYGWAGTGPNQSDAAMNPVIAVDNNPSSFADPVTGFTQLDATSGAVYVAWSTRLAPPNGGNPPPPPTFNPNIILLVGSFDGGTTFSSPVPLDGSGLNPINGVQRDTTPRLVVGGASIAAGSTVQASPPPTATSFAGGAALSSTDQFYDGYFLTITSGPNNGLSRTVTTYNGNSHVFTFLTGFPTAPAAGTTFVLSRTTAGQVTAVWDDFGTNDLVNPASPPFDSIVSNSVTGGGGQNFPGTTGAPADAAGGTPNVAATTAFTATVNVGNPGVFPTITDLDVSVSLSDQNLSDLHLKLLSPTIGSSTVQAAPPPSASSFAGGATLSSTNDFYDGFVLTFTSGLNQGRSRTIATYNGTTKVFTFSSPWGTAPAAGDSFTISKFAITLINNRTNADGTTNMGIGISGTSLGFENGVDLGTVFDQEAVRFITDMGAAAPFIGHFKPEGAFDDNATLASISGQSAAAVNGTWTLLVTDTRQETNPTTPFILTDWSLNFTEGMNLGRQTFVGATNVLGRNLTPYPLAPAVSPTIGIGPAPVIAQDNTLGSFSPYQGRIYASWVAHDIFSGNPVDNTYIVLVHSDDGGLSWSRPTVVNDDSIVDNINSEGTRPKFEPQIAVDQTTGTLVMSFLDARNDAARARYATYIATSIDGGNTFAPETFVNQAQTATDVITGKTVVAEPIPDNVSAGNGSKDGTYGMGFRQGLAVAAGNIYPVWAGNFNGNNLLYGRTSTERLKTDILTTQVEIPAGPRIISSTMGPVQATTVDGFTFNNQFTADGRPLVNGFTVTFDRPVDPGTFTPADVTVFYRDTVTPASQPGTLVNVSSVTPLDQGPFGPARAQLATTFFVAFQTPQSGVGTYSYSVGPNIRDAIRSLSSNVTPGVTQSFNSTTNNQPIPDNSTIDNTISVSGFAGNQVITNVQVQVNIQHTQDSDLTITLIAPDGTRVLLALQEGSASDPGNQNFTNTNFADGFPSIRTGTAPYSGFFSPEGRLADLIGKSPNGTWTLEINDGFVLDTGTLLNWQLRIRPGTKSGLNTNFGNLMDQNGNAITGEAPFDIYATPRPLNGVPFQLPYDQDTLPMIVPGPHIVSTFVPNNPVTPDNLVLNQTVNSIDVVFDRDMDPTTFTTAAILRMMGPAGQINGPFTITPNPNGTDPDPAHPRTFKIGFPTQQLSGTYTVTLAPIIRAKAQPGQTVGDLMDTNENAGVDVLRGVNPTVSTLTPISHTYSGPPVTIAPGKIIEIPLNFGPENFVIGGGVTAPPSPQVQLNITYPNDPDLEASLISPDGTTIKLFTNVGGGPGPKANFTNTILSDNAATPIQNGVPPFNSSINGPFDPQTPLSVLNGRAAAGTYTLVIKDDASSVTGTHTLNSWSVTLFEAVPGTGLGEAVADQATAHFRIFTMDTQNPLSHNVWTAVGPASENGGGNSGRIGGIAVDPSDPSGNTVYVAGASGGVWKTTNFLTTDANGPTYIPLTDFGPTFAINIGSIAVFGRNNDPNQSIIFASTGEGDTGSSGVGAIISTNGGATWNLLDSTINVDSTGNYLPINSTLRDHMFVGTTSFKIVVDPVHGPGGPNDVVVYMALGGNATNGGLWRSLDSGKHWTRMTTTAGTSPSNTATDVVLAPASALNGSGNLQLVYAAFEGAGVYKSVSEGTNLTLMAGNGGNGTYRDFNFSPPTSIPVNNDAVSPNGANGRIVLATVTILTGNPVQDLLYEGWLYAAVATTGGHLQGLYLTKDGGGNWTKIRLPLKVPDPTRPFGFPSNDESLPDHDPLGANVGGGLTLAQGNYDISLTIDPTNPNICYLGGTEDFQFNPASGLIRVDSTVLYDPHNTIPFDNDDPDGGAVMRNTNGAITVKTAGDGFKFDTYGLITAPTIPNAYLNLLTDPENPFLSNSTLLFTHVASFSNEGAEAIWNPFDAVNGTTDQHRVVAIKDPLTGHARLIFGDDQGIFSVVDKGDGSFTTGIGSAQEGTGARNGNLQIIQFYYGAAQPSILAAQVGQALLYGNAQDDGFPTSDPNILNNGNIGWNGPTGDGSGIATDQTGSGSAYSYQWPCCGINLASTDFFLVAPNGPGYISRTGTASGFSLVQQNNPGPVPDPQWPFLAAGAGRGEVQSNFAVNPINGNQIIIGSAAGRLFRTLDQGRTWGVIADPATLDGTTIPALAFGAPDPANPANNQGDFIYVGTTGGKLFMTPDGGGHWFPLTTDSSGHSLDGSSVMSITTNPTRGTKEAYLVTTNGVYHITFDVKYPTNAAPTISNVVLTNVTGNVFNLTTNFSNPNNTLLFQLTTTGTTVVGEQKPLNYLTSIVADWRFQVPDNPANPTGPAHPYLYIGGEGGVYRSTDVGKTWTIFPDVAHDGSPVDGGYLPMAHVTDLDLAVGAVDPANGKPDQSRGPNILIATTYGRGDFAIRLPINSPFNLVSGPVIQSIKTTPGTSVSSVKVTFKGAVDPATFTPADIDSFIGPTGQPIQVTSITDLTPAPTPSNPSPSSVFQLNFATQNTPGVYTIVIGPNIADFSGTLMDQDLDGINGGQDDIFTGRFFVNNNPNPPPVPAIIGHDSNTGQLRVAISNGVNGFNDSIFFTISNLVHWVNFVTGDFNGDGKTDVAARDGGTGNWWVGINTGNSFSFSVWAQWSVNPAVTWVDVQAADFNGAVNPGTGLPIDDILGRWQQAGQWYVATSLGTSFNTTLWATWSTSPGVTWTDVHVGDFNGDGMKDITGRWQQGGQWYTGISNGTGFQTTMWAQWSAAATWVDTQVGDFNGAVNPVTGRKMDGIASRYLEAGSWWVANSTGTSFVTSQWATWSTATAWLDVRVGDFDGNGLSDIIGRAAINGQWYVGLSNGTNAFTTTLWDTWANDPSVTWADVIVGDFNGDGKDDIAGRYAQAGQWYVGLSNGAKFTTSLWDTWPTSANWADVRLMKSV